MSEKKRRKNLKPLFIVLSILLFLFIAYLLTGYFLTTSGKSFPNLTAESVPVGGMSREEITATLESAGWADMEANDLTVSTFADQSVDINPVSAGVLTSRDSTVDAALSFGKQDGISLSPVHYLQCLMNSTDICSESSVDDEYIYSKINELQNALDSALGSYQIEEKNGELVLYKGYGTGLPLNKPDLYNAIVGAMENHENNLEFKELSGSPDQPDFQALHDEICQEAQPASFSTDGSHEILDGTPGYEFDVAEAASLWEEANYGEAITIPLEVTYSDVTADTLKDNMYIHLLGAMTTKYNNSNDNRSSNVRLATSLVNGTEIYPGEEFSFNQTVGKRTEEAGFLLAPAYAGYDDIQDELGGGVCQVSSGIYASALFAFLEITSRTCHVYPPNYMQLGTDATVSIPEVGREIDLKIKNNKSYPIKIVGYCEEGENPDTGKPLKTVTIEIWGTLEDDDYMPVEFDNAWGDVYSYDRVIEPAIEGREGYRIQFTHDETEFEDDTGKGLRTLTYRRVYDSDGNLVEKKILNPLYDFGYGMDTYYYKS